MGISLGKRLTIVFIIPILILMGLGFFYYRNGLASIEYTHWFSHTVEVIAAVTNIRSDVKDMETGQRGYLITGKDEYLDAYYAGSLPLQHDINYVRQLTQDNPIQQKKLDALVPLIAGKASELKETINLRRFQGFEAARVIVLSDFGMNKMNDIRKVIKEMLNEENALLKK